MARRYAHGVEDDGASVCAGLSFTWGLGITAWLRKAGWALQAAQLDRMMGICAGAGNLVHELQKERGRSAGFVGSKGHKFGQELRDQRQDTQRLAEALNEIIVASGHSQAVGHMVSNGLKGVETLTKTRQEIDALVITGAQVIETYNRIIRDILDSVGTIAVQGGNQDLLRSGLAYLALLRAKEYAGQERATLSNAFGAGALDIGLFGRWSSILALQNEQIAEFAAFAEPALLSMQQSMANGPEEAEVNKWREFARQHAGKDQLGVDAGQWFTASTKRIDRYKELEERRWNGASGESPQPGADGLERGMAERGSWFGRLGGDLACRIRHNTGHQRVLEADGGIRPGGI